MDFKKFLFICCLIAVFTSCAVSACDNETLDLSDCEFSNPPQSQSGFDELQSEIDNCDDILVLDKDYRAYPSDKVVSINKSVTIDGMGHTLDGDNSKRVFMIRADNVVLKNINFINSRAGVGGSIAWSGENATIINCTFKNNTGSTAGGAVAIKGDNARIINSTFENNTVNSGTYGAVSILENNTEGMVYMTVMEAWGGAVYIDGDYAMISNSLFVNNTSQKTSEGDGGSKGGAVILTGLNCSLAMCEFRDNSAVFGANYYSTHDISIKNITFTDNFDNLQYLIDNAYETLILDKDYDIKQICEININKPLIIDGRGHNIYTLSPNYRINGFFKINSDNVVLKNINFINFKSNDEGGIIWIGENATIINCTFKNNTGLGAGGAVAVKGNNTRIINSTFENNNILYKDYYEYFVKERRLCLKYYATAYGGAVYIDGDNAIISNSVFINNTAAKYKRPDYESQGGAVKINGFNCTIADCKFIDNSAVSGPHYYSTYDITIKNTTFYQTVKKDLSKITGDNLIIYYKSGKKFTVKVYDENGSACKNTYVRFTLNHKEYNIKTDSNGEASLKINLKPGRYTIITSYNDKILKKSITVKNRLITNDLTKKVKKTAAFKVKVLNTNGKAFAKQKVKVKFKGKVYNIKTNSKGIASLKLGKNIKAGKYTIKTIYDTLTNTNKVTVKK